MSSILIMDSNSLKKKIAQEVIRDNFASAGEVYEASNVSEAAAIFERAQADIMILDIGANNNSISSFVNQVKRKRPETEIVITTSGSENEAIMANVRMKCSGYLLKPYSPEELVSILRPYVEESDRRQKEGYKNQACSNAVKGIKQGVESCIFAESRSSCLEYINFIYDRSGSTAEIIDKLNDFVKGIIRLMEESEFTLALDTVEQIRKMKYEMYRYDDRTEAYRLLVDIVKQVFTEYEKKHEYHDEIKKSLNYIDMNIISDISLDDAADYANISKYYFSKLFKKKTGTNFITYVIDERMKIAKILLENTDKPVAAIADILAYDETNYFSKAFKKSTGMTPTAFRKSCGRER
ncbi:MAG: helix-turn-helix domain-containing protein [Eubacteriaceae bacterium]|jgi:YesN/AraC family two-component response regulator|nr:helix-turn-helix domain-containing protein [Eubacteriaceae bacterium]